MKTLYGVLILLALSGCASISKSDLVPTASGNDFMLLSAEQAKECREGGGCEIYSVREFRQAVQIILQRMMRQGS